MGFDPNTARYSYRVLSVVAATAWTDGLKPCAAQVSRRRRLPRRSPRSCCSARFHVPRRHRRDANSVMRQSAAAAAQLRRRRSAARSRSRRWRLLGGAFRGAQNAVPSSARQVGPVVPVQPQQGCWAQRCAGRSRSSCDRAAVVREAHESTPHRTRAATARSHGELSENLVGYRALAAAF